MVEVAGQVVRVRGGEVGDVEDSEAGRAERGVCALAAPLSRRVQRAHDREVDGEHRKERRQQPQGAAPEEGPQLWTEQVIAPGHGGVHRALSFGQITRSAGGEQAVAFETPEQSVNAEHFDRHAAHIRLFIRLDAARPIRIAD